MKTFITLSIFFSSIFAGTLAYACSCAEQKINPEQMYEKSEAVFVGKMLGDEMVVETAFKGIEVKKRLAIKWRDSLCAGSRVDGFRYLIYLDKKPVNTWEHPHLCETGYYVIGNIAMKPAEPTAWLKKHRTKWITDQVDGSDDPESEKIAEKTEVKKPTIEVKKDPPVEAVAAKKATAKPKASGCATGESPSGSFLICAFIWFGFRRRSK